MTLLLTVPVDPFSWCFSSCLLLSLQSADIEKLSHIPITFRDFSYINALMLQKREPKSFTHEYNYVVNFFTG